MVNSEIVKKLNSINWNFDFSINYNDKAIRPFNCRKYYSYPATFIPEIPYALIEILSNKGDVVLDPFGGIGTTFMQALLLERYPTTFDINIAASEVSSTIFCLFDPSVNYKSIKTELLSLPEKFDSCIDYTVQLSLLRSELKGWFESTTFNELAYLFVSYDNTADSLIKSTLKLTLSSLLTSLSSQNKGWAYIADNVKPKDDEFRRKDVFKQYKQAITTLFADVTSYTATLEQTWGDYADYYADLLRKKRIFNKSLLDINISNNSVDLIVTSPPYPKMIDYVKSQRLSFSFFEEDFHMYMQYEIGARYRRTRADALVTYVDTMKKHINKMQEILKDGGFLCLVLPDYEDNTKEKERRKAISDVITHCYELGFHKVEEISRYIPSHKRTLSIQWATLVNESIFIFQKG